MEDADLDEAATLAAAGSYKNSGQRCTAVKRMLVHEAVADALRRAAARADAGLDATATRWIPTIDMGTVIDEAAAKSFEARVERRGRAAARGCCTATCAAARSTRRRCSTTSRPTCRWCKYETFGPVSPVIRFRDIDDAIRDRQRRPPTACRRRSAPTGSTTSRASSPSSTSARVNVREVPGLPARADAVRRHQGLRPGLQGRRAGGDEELHQHQDVLAAMVSDAPRDDERSAPPGDLAAEGDVNLSPLRRAFGGRARARAPRARCSTPTRERVPAPVAVDALLQRARCRARASGSTDVEGRRVHGLPRQQRPPGRLPAIRT